MSDIRNDVFPEPEGPATTQVSGVFKGHMLFTIALKWCLTRLCHGTFQVIGVFTSTS